MATHREYYDDTAFDVSSNPELILMQRQGDVDECDVTTSLWLSGKAVTSFKQSNFED